MRSDNDQGKPDRVTYTHGRTVNMGNYNSLRVEARLESDIQPEESYKDALIRVRESVMEFVLDDLAQLTPKDRDYK